MTKTKEQMFDKAYEVYLASISPYEKRYKAAQRSARKDYLKELGRIDELPEPE